MNPNSWGIFHDGGLDKIKGEIPGELNLNIGILYLRQMFPGVGSGFIVYLKNYTLLEYTEYSEQPTRDLSLIEKSELELVSVESTNPILLNCVTGTLQLAYETASVTLDTGEPVTDSELASASKKYWETWKQKWQKGS